MDRCSPGRNDHVDRAFMLIAHPDAPWWHGDFVDAINPVNGATPLARAAMLLAAHRSALLRERSDVDIRLAEIGDLVRGCEPTFTAWHRRLFVELEFAGNGDDYHDPRNSFLPDVVQRRTGIPISLAVVAIDTGSRLGLDIWGVGMPGHFLVGTPDPTAAGPSRASEATVFVDAFHGGAILDTIGCARLHESMFGAGNFQTALLRPTPTPLVLVRMCNNLKSNYARLRDLDGLTAVMRLRCALPAYTLDEGRELVRLLHATGSWREALYAIDQLRREFPIAAAILDEEASRITASFN